MYELKNGNTIEDEQQAAMMEKLLSLAPDKHIDYSWTDIGMAQLFIDLCCHNLRYCPDNKRWYKWLGYWKGYDHKGAPSEALMQMLQLLRLYCNEVEME